MNFLSNNKKRIMTVVQQSLNYWTLANHFSYEEEALNTKEQIIRRKELVTSYSRNARHFFRAMSNRTELTRRMTWIVSPISLGGAKWVDPKTTIDT